MGRYEEEMITRALQQQAGMANAYLGAGSAIGYGGAQNALEKKQTAAEETIKNAQALAERALELCNRLEEKLKPIAREPTTILKNEAEKAPLKPPPPQLFVSINTSINGICYSLERIEDLISRLEI